MHHPPKPDELEISVFGPGYGESVLIHVGNGVWFAIDSCVNHSTKRPAPLDYLNGIGVNPATGIVLIIASHWHDDHVRGLHDLLLASESASFSCSLALTKAEFLTLAKIYSTSQGKIPSGPQELYRCLETMKERTQQAGGGALNRWATIDKLLYQTTFNQPIKCKLTALSPSDEMLSRTQQFMLGYLNAVKKGYSEPRLLSSCPNDVAVALLLEIGDRRVLFGSDLEQETNKSVGWSAVMTSQTVKASGKSCVFKVAHHGAYSGHSDDVWSDLLAETPLAILTPFQHGSLKIPTEEDRARILSKTNKAYITASPDMSVKLPKKSTKVQSFVDSTVKNRRLASGPMGHVRWRVSLTNSEDLGNVELFGQALPLDEVNQQAR